MLANYSQQVAQLQAQNAAITQKYEDMLNRPPQVLELGATALPANLTNTLTEFANANPDIVTFDASRGVVKFKSDVTFGSGSTDLNERAISTLQRFASILNSSEAVGYELMVAGHTDNQRVTRQATINAGNFDNWYLSSHRAISVAAELVKNGVSKARLGVAGYADQQPIASNSSEAGRSQNRRVEIVILPTHPRSGSVAPAIRLAPAPLLSESPRGIWTKTPTPPRMNARRCPSSPAPNQPASLSASPRRQNDGGAIFIERLKLALGGYNDPRC